MISISSLRQERAGTGAPEELVVVSVGDEGPPGAALAIIGGRLEFCGAPEVSFFSDMASYPSNIARSLRGRHNALTMPSASRRAKVALRLRDNAAK
jgi:hypothetical protein